jgi:hypothetical protein
MSSNELYEILKNAYVNKSPIQAVVRVGDEKRTRVGVIDALVHRSWMFGYVTIALQDGTYRTTRLPDVESVMVS